ncbi:MAG: hypothetical protein A3C47_06560 [Omnitrophica bacterium RIFCSPHIGHO2_02_FULL_51_18]|nr:MAG: hypothetical protein A3C47_06560 [Omnitrophica bacterium RIFCSPHIGHO2_02_FULL_51_18]
MDPRAIVGSPSQVSESSFISKVYLWMAGGLFLSAAASFWLLSQPELLKAVVTNKVLFFGLIIAELGLVIGLSAALMRLSAFAATVMFCVYSFLNGATLTPVFLIYTGASIMTTFAVTAGTFLFFSLYGMTTKRDLTSVGAFAVMALIGVILASVVNIFLKSPALMWVTTFIGIAVFLGLIAYDTQKLKAMHAMGFQDEDVRKKMAIMGALALYLDFVNLFLNLLRIFGRQRN